MPTLKKFILHFLLSKVTRSMREVNHLWFVSSHPPSIKKSMVELHNPSQLSPNRIEIHSIFLGAPGKVCTSWPCTRCWSLWEVLGHSMVFLVTDGQIREHFLHSPEKDKDSGNLIYTTLMNIHRTTPCINSQIKKDFLFAQEHILWLSQMDTFWTEVLTPSKISALLF